MLPPGSMGWDSSGFSGQNLAPFLRRYSTEFHFWRCLGFRWHLNNCEHFTTTLRWDSELDTHGDGSGSTGCCSSASCRPGVPAGCQVPWGIRPRGQGRPAVWVSCHFQKKHTPEAGRMGVRRTLSSLLFIRKRKVERQNRSLLSCRGAREVGEGALTAHIRGPHSSPCHYRVSIFAFQWQGVLQCWNKQPDEAALWNMECFCCFEQITVLCS